CHTPRVQPRRRLPPRTPAAPPRPSVRPTGRAASPPNTVYANDQPWAVITEKNEPYPALRTVSTKAAFGWYYLFPEKPYTLKLIDLAEDLQSHNEDGFYAGIYEETEDINTILTGNTNGLILEILYYKALGRKPILEVASKQR
ncbi:MAG: DUF3131 domain-containing protein, partial [Leptolyngbya sp. SIO4C5]|nr:DUF3131 domain-containing protein [Leptolyngbya sp. SIO4C5]